MKFFYLALFVLLSACKPDASNLESEGPKGVAETAWEVTPVLPGSKAPSFEALRPTGENFRFDSYSLRQGAILVFYRGGWCPYCNRQLAALQEVDDELVAMGYDLYFLSADSPARLSEGSLGPDVPFSLLSDNTMAVSTSYGIAYKVEQETIDRYKEGGLDLAEEAGYSHYLLPAPSVFVVDSAGIIQFQYTNPDFRVRLNNELLTTAARVFASVD
ncbi:AhpC/TSA family protein [bacterium]|nr:AhpC/TSA family protein [bacterium]